MKYSVRTVQTFYTFKYTVVITGDNLRGRLSGRITSREVRLDLYYMRIKTTLRYYSADMACQIMPLSTAVPPLGPYLSVLGVDVFIVDRRGR